MGDDAASAEYCVSRLKPAMDGARSISDALERVVDKELWPFPNYERLCYEHHFDVKL
jgi:glutamine synthetase type III